MLAVALAPLLLSAVVGHQRQIDNLPFTVPEPLFAGQREVILGPVPYRDTVMSVIYSKDIVAAPDMKGINPPAWDEYPVGTIRWSVKPDTFGGQSCIAIRLLAIYLPKYSFTFRGGKKKVETSLDIRGTSEWWVKTDGTILRQFESRADGRGLKTANCTYDKDSVNVLLDLYGKRTTTTLYPGDMDKVQAQFKPMVVDGKVAIPEKDYLVYDPFTSGFVKRTVKVSAKFGGTYLSIKFKGTSYDFDGICSDGSVKVYIDEEGDLVKEDLPKNRFIILGVTPPGKEGKTG